MRKTHTVRIESATDGAHPPFVRSGLDDTTVVAVVTEHLKRTTSGKQVLTLRLEDGSPDLCPRVESVPDTRERIDEERASIDNLYKDAPNGLKIALTRALISDLAQTLVSANELFHVEGSPSDLRQAMLALQAVREALDDMASELHAEINA